MLTSEGLQGPKRADKAPARRRADKRSPQGLSVLTRRLKGAVLTSGGLKGRSVLTG